MVRILDTYQQTFVCSTAATSQKFNFKRVYKNTPLNKIKLSVNAATSSGTIIHQKTSSHLGHPISFIMNELPLGDFTISLEHLSRTVLADVCEFLVCFQIDVCE